MSNNQNNNEASQEYDFLTMTVPVAPVSFEDLLFGPGFLSQDNVTDYSSIEPIPYPPATPFSSLGHPICSREEFFHFEHETDLSRAMSYAAHDEVLAHNIMSKIKRDFSKIQCESESVRGILLTTYGNPYTNLFDISVQEQEHNDEDKHLYRYTYGRKDGVYSSIWYRNLIDGNERDGGERYCAPCNEWHNTRNHAWANHQTSVHGISAVTKSLYPFPSGVVLDKKSNKLKGYCPKCDQYIHLYIKKVGTVWTTWFRHQDAHIRKEMQDRRGGKIVTPNNRRNSKKRKLVEVEAQVEKVSPLVDVSASNTVLDFEFMNKKRCFEVADVVTDVAEDLDLSFLEQDVLVEVFPEFQVQVPEEVQGSQIEEGPVAQIEPEVDHFEASSIELPFFNFPYQSDENSTTCVDSTSPSADYSENEVQDMMDLIDMEMDITEELSEETIVSSDVEPESEDFFHDSVPTIASSPITDTSPEIEEFKSNPFEGELDDFDGLFGDYDF
ncbi:hypothetical protein CJU90_3284 [Yarrowia sp. C11]|nr:hypothetical protein CKK34_4731 [Yarrowia sp. E02]KAG5369761.1 hypothetical protein CJU90_3284 [Yarrowia sp. C11]